MQVELENLEPGSVVEIPDALKEAGYRTPRLIYAGTQYGYPRLMSANAGAWSAINWPSQNKGLGLPYPVPKAFSVTKDEEMLKTFLNWANNSSHYVGQTYSSGCDPEIFVVDAKDKVIPARKVLPKKGPYTARFFDGIQAEFCPNAGGCLEGLANQIRSQLNLLLQDFRTKHKDAKLSIVNSIQLTQKEMDALEDEDVVFRCSESLNVYKDLPVSPEPRKYLWRFAGGHIHVGCKDNVNKPLPILYNMVRAMDAIVGVASVSLARHFDTPERRKTYGRAGEFRIPSHGLEYRVLSNFWLCSPLIYHLVFEMARWGYRLGETGVFQLAWQGSEEETRECINNCDVALAEKLIKRNAGIYNKLFQERWSAYSYRNGKQDLVKKAMDTIMNGADVVVKDPTDIPGNWFLGDKGSWGTYGDCENAKWRNVACK